MKSPIQDKLKEKHTRTPTNKTNKDKTQKKNIKSSKGKATSNIQGKPHTFNSWSFSRNSAGQKGMAGYISSTERLLNLASSESTTKITVPGKDLIQNCWRNKKLSGQSKVMRIQYHQTKLTTIYSQEMWEEKKSTKSTPNN